MVSKKSRSEVRRKKHMKLRNRFSGTAQRPRLAVFRSNNHMYAQIIDDTVGNTLVSASTLQKEVKAELEKTNDVEAAAYLGILPSMNLTLLSLYIFPSVFATKNLFTYFIFVFVM